VFPFEEPGVEECADEGDVLHPAGDQLGCRQVVPLEEQWTSRVR
jgi:hypothetical protein